MAKNSFLNMNKSLLHKVCEEVDLLDKKSVIDLEERMYSAYWRLGGKVQGLAAPQIYEYKRVILCRFKTGDPMVWFNPTILFRLGNKKSNEGCESEGRIRYEVRRPRVLLVSYYKGSKKHYMLCGFKKARIIVHEIDHLDGVLLSDHGIPILRS